MPILRLVPGFEGIRIHASLSSRCICVGDRSREDTLTKILKQAQQQNEPIFIAIATEYSLIRQLTDDETFELCPPFTA